MRLLVYDRTCGKLSTAWFAGSVLYRGLQRIDACRGVRNWQEALTWLATHEPSKPIEEIQYWGHGKWGRVLVADDTFDAAAFREGHPLHRWLLDIRARLTPDALFWLRTCEAFGARPGIEFAQRLAETLGVRVAGHTYIIGAIQSGLRALKPGCTPTWSAEEGLAEGTPEAPQRALWSKRTYPRTITCFANEFPPAWFSDDSR